MIYVTGDTHGDVTHFFQLPGMQGWDEDDTLIVCGDFGFVFRDNEEEREKLDYLSFLPFQILFVDGNHENFPALYRFPEEEWNGGRVHRLRPNILHLMRGQVFTIQGKTFFTMGGGYSIDRYLRQLGSSFWIEEMPSQAEYDEGRANLERHHREVDYIITHTAPLSVVRDMGFDIFRGESDLALEDFFTELSAEVQFSHWYFGHWHCNVDVGEKFTCLWKDTRVLEA